MRRNTLTVLAMIVLAAVPVTGFTQGKTTRDPSAVSRVEAKAADIDPRLDQKITYDSGAKRLHYIIDDISRISGVNIISGKSKDDWRVKDIPMVVCVKDMPLGKLLNAIAEASHTRLGSERIRENDPAKTYRIYRRSPDEAELDNFIKSRSEAALAQAKWQWDAAVAYGKAAEIPGVPRRMHLMAKAMASFGPDAWDRLVKGETLRFTIKDSARSSVFKEYYQCIWDEERGNDPENTGELTDADMGYAIFKVKLTELQYNSAMIQAYFGPVRLAERHITHDTGRINTNLLKEKGFPVPPYPEAPKTPGLSDQMTYPDAVFLLNYQDKWNRPLLTAKFDLDKPKEIKEPTFADLIRELARLGKCNIVTEDFYSHRGATQSWGAPILPADAFRKGTSLAETLKLRSNGVPNVWFFNESDKLLIGWHSFWYESHWHLVPESFVNTITEASKSTGIGLDDVVHACCLPSRSFADWIIAYKDLRFLEMAWLDKDPMWQLYDALTPADKQLARSEAGLNLGKFDPDWIAGFVSKYKISQYLQPETPLFALEMNTEQEEKHQGLLNELAFYKEKALADPKVIAGMVIRVHESPADYFTKADGSNIVKLLNLKQYHISVDYTIDGTKHRASLGGPQLRFPVLSAEREAELVRAAQTEAVK